MSDTTKIYPLPDQRVVEILDRMHDSIDFLGDLLAEIHPDYNSPKFLVFNQGIDRTRVLIAAITDLSSVCQSSKETL